LISLGSGFILVCGCCEYGNETSVFIKYMEFFAWLVSVGEMKSSPRICDDYTWT